MDKRKHSLDFKKKKSYVASEYHLRFADNSLSWEVNKGNSGQTQFTTTLYGYVFVI